MNREQVELGFVFSRLKTAVFKLLLVHFAGIDSQGRLTFLFLKPSRDAVNFIRTGKYQCTNYLMHFYRKIISKCWMCQAQVFECRLMPYL